MFGGANLNKQPGPLNAEALQMLRDQNVKKFTVVETSDGFNLGRALRIHLRRDDINPDLKLYAAYLQVNSPILGSHYFIPTDFIKEYKPEEGKLILSVPEKDVEEEMWNRDPSFIVGHLSEIEELA